MDIASAVDEVYRSMAPSFGPHGDHVLITSQRTIVHSLVWNHFNILECCSCFNYSHFMFCFLRIYKNVFSLLFSEIWIASNKLHFLTHSFSGLDILGALVFENHLCSFIDQSIRSNQSVVGDSSIYFVILLRSFVHFASKRFFYKT